MGNHQLRRGLRSHFEPSPASATSAGLGVYLLAAREGRDGKDAMQWQKFMQ
jgi:hypothetical protein